jgi:DNA mismatch repair protein MutS2
LLHEVEARDQALRQREAELTAERENAERARAELSDRLSSVGERERELRRRERDAEQRARHQAREFLLDARKRLEAAIQTATEARTEEAAREARRELERAIQETRGGEQALAGSGAALQVAPGGRVRLAAGGLGRVEEVRDDGRLVVIAGSIRLVVPADAVAEVLPAAPPGGGRPVPDRQPEPPAADVSLEADLRGMRVDEAEAALLSAVDAAILADQPFLRIIHGKGTGAVRDRVHTVLRTDRRIDKYGLAPANQGGSGVTIVEFRA